MFPTPEKSWRILLWLAAFLAAGASRGTPAAEPPASLSVLAFGARGDGTGDDTAAVQRALDQAAAAGGVVWMPAGQYAIRGVLAIPVGVTLEGVWLGMHHGAQAGKGTTLLAYAGRGDEQAAPFISLRSGSTVKGLTIVYPEQRIEAIQPYPWTIQGRGLHYNVIDTTIANAYDGIDCGTYPNEGHHLSNVLLCAVHRGVYIDHCTDIGRLENVHIHPNYWIQLPAPWGFGGRKEKVDALMDTMRAHLEGFVIARTDWEYVSNSFVIWAKIGFHFVKRPDGSANVLITQSGSDLGPLAVKVDEVQPSAGVAFENCQFMSGFEIAPENKGPIKLTNCGFWWTQSRTQSGSQMILEGQGTVTLTATHFHLWDKGGTGDPCVDARGGSLLMQGCDFMPVATQSPHIRLGPKVMSAAILGTRFEGGEMRIRNETTGDVQILGNVRH
ncbi:MAG TPA: glycosyl hydrolase family 28-related protein [Opitutaceae bacterium]|nr:glycosyl hydrolase family 28-related protein [Opitutaceae bacterium]